MQKLPEFDVMKMMKVLTETEDGNPDYIQNAIDYIAKLKDLLPEFISTSISDDIKTITDLNADPDWTVKLIREHMNFRQVVALSIYAKRLQGFDIVSESIARKVIEEGNCDNNADTAFMTVSVIADYVIRIIVAVDPSILDEALKLKGNTK